MTASTVKSGKISNGLDALPRVVQDSRGLGGLLHLAVDTVEAATTSLDEAGDVILMLPLPSHALLSSLRIYNDDLDSGGTSGAVDIGIYNGPEAFNDTDSGKTAYAAYAVIDQDGLATAITTLTAANTAGVEVRFEAGAAVHGDIADINKALWEVLGLASDPNRTFVVGITVTTQMTTPVAGTISLAAQYTN